MNLACVRCLLQAQTMASRPAPAETIYSGTALCLRHLREAAQEEKAS